MVFLLVRRRILAGYEAVFGMLLQVMATRLASALGMRRELRILSLRVAACPKFRLASTMRGAWKNRERRLAVA